VSTVTSAPVPAHWLTAALDALGVFGAPCGTALLRQQPEDFRVDERLSFEPSGSGSHVLLHVEKRDANTVWVAKKIAEAARTRVHDVGFAGIKDRHAVTRQWFSVPARGRSAASWEGFAGEGFEVQAASSHHRKLPRGALKGNHFRIILRDVQGPKEIFEDRLATMVRDGIANYFGPQRFGRDAGNLQVLAEASAENSGTVVRAGDRAGGWVISTARSVLFNAVLAERVRLGTWRTLFAGERANLDGSNSSFVVEAVDETIKERLARLDIHPTGPMPGDGSKVAFGGEIAALESRILDEYADLRHWLSTVGAEAARRPLRARVEDLHYEWSADGSILELSFALRSGSFATALLRELVPINDSLPEGVE
jgi:tRNA pseudouridine13 synthase